MKKIEKINRNQKKYGLSLNRTSSGRGLALNRTRSGLGFTIIELMVVVLIIAILASIVIVTLEKGKLKARDSQRKADLASIATSLENYRVDKKGYPIPAESESQPCDISSTTCLNNATFLTYQISIPVDPLNDSFHKYKYQTDKKGSQFKITAQSEGITSDGAKKCSDVSAEVKQKAGDYCDPADNTRFQISSSSVALMWEP